MVAPLVAAAARKVVADKTRDKAAERIEALRQRRLGQTQAEESQHAQVTFFQYLPALMVAGLKFVLDLVLVGSLPGVGTAITVGFSVLMFLSLTLARLKNAFQPRIFIRRLIVLSIMDLVEGLAFPLNLLPFETGSVLLLYFLEKKDSQK